MKDVRDALFVAQTSDGRLVRRPLSPHLGIYRLQLSMVLSGAYRMSGIACSLGTLLLVWWLVAAASGPSAFRTVQYWVGNPLGLVVLFGWTAGLVFHTVGGLRHLAWDAGYGFSKPVFNRTGVILVVTTILLTLLIYGIGLSVWTSAGAAAHGG